MRPKPKHDDKNDSVLRIGPRRWRRAEQTSLSSVRPSGPFVLFNVLRFLHRRVHTSYVLTVLCFLASLCLMPLCVYLRPRLHGHLLTFHIIAYKPAKRTSSTCTNLSRRQRRPHAHKQRARAPQKGISWRLARATKGKKTSQPITERP